MPLAERVKERMRARGFVHRNGEPNIKAAEKEIHLAYATLHNIVTGVNRNPSKATLEKLASGLGTTVEWLLEEERTGGTWEQGAEWVVNLMRQALDAAEEEIKRHRKRSAAPMPPGSWQYVPRPTAEGAIEPGDTGEDATDDQ